VWLLLEDWIYLFPYCLKLSMGQLIALDGWFELLATRFQVLTVLLIKIPVFWMLCCLDWSIVADVLKYHNSLLLTMKAM